MRRLVCDFNRRNQKNGNTIEIESGSEIRNDNVRIYLGIGIVISGLIILQSIDSRPVL